MKLQNCTVKISTWCLHDVYSFFPYANCIVRNVNKSSGVLCAPGINFYTLHVFYIRKSGYFLQIKYAIKYTTNLILKK